MQPDDPPGVAADQFVIVCDEQNRLPIAIEVGQEIHQAAEVAPVLAHRRLVEDEQPGGEGQGRGQGGTLLLSGAQRLGTAVADGGQIGGLQHGLDAVARSLAVVARAEADLFLYFVAHQLVQRILEKQPHTSPR